MASIDRKGGEQVFNPNITPSTGLLTPKNGPNTLITPEFDKYFRTHERVMWQVSDIPFDQIDGNLIIADEVAAVRWATLIESHNPVFTGALLDYYRMDHEMAADAIMWGYEELKHYMADRTYLSSPALRAYVDLQDLDRELNETRAGVWGEKESKFNAYQVAVYRMVQEVATGRYYFGLATHTKEPVLKDMARTIGKDEMRHADREFDKAMAEMDKKPRKQALEEADEVFFSLDMPGSTFIPDYQKYKEPVRRATGIGVRDVVAVLRKISDLVGKPHVLKLAQSRELRDKVLGGYNIDPGQVMRHFVLGPQIRESSS